MKIAICPDIHGRTFWKNVATRINEFDKVIFLGDYLDPYPHEWPYYIEDLDRHTINNFLDIINFKKSYPDKIVLLLGNHDCSYLMSKDVCNCRCDSSNYNEIRDIFIKNKNLFQLVYQYDKYLFSHAGVRDDWKDTIYKDVEDSKIVDILNSEYLDYDPTLGIYDTEHNIAKIPAILSACSYYRGGSSITGSIIWADIVEPISDRFGYQVFGHSQLKDCLVTEKWACLDCRRAFILDNQEFTEMDGSKISVKKLGKNSNI